MITNYFDKEFELTYFEMNELGVASPTTILTLLEETAADHCLSIDYSLFQLAEQNIGWVLVSGIMQMDRYPAYKEKITIRTWLSSYTTVKGYRENLIYDEQNNIIGRAKGLWIFFDIQRRRPIQIFDEIRARWSFCPEESITSPISKKIQPVRESDTELKFKIHRYDTDMIKHVNNIRYLQWVVESIPEEIIDTHYLQAIDGRFIAEAHYGQTVVSLLKNETQSSQEVSYKHSITIEGSQKVCATAITTWKKL